MSSGHWMSLSNFKVNLPPFVIDLTKGRTNSGGVVCKLRLLRALEG